MQKVKHIVQIRFLSQDFHNGWNLLDDNLIGKCLSRMTSTVIPSLSNQTNMDFQVVFLINPKLAINQYCRIQKAVADARPNFMYKLIPHNQGFRDYLRGIWSASEIVVLSRVDDDDFVNKYVVQDTRDMIEKHGDFQAIVCGYNSGYKYMEDINALRHWNASYFRNGGHASMFQSIITNTVKVPYDKNFNPLFQNHTKTFQCMPRDKYDIVYENLERNEAFIRVVHENSSEYNKNIEKVTREIASGQNIEVTQDLILKLKQDFAFDLKLDSVETPE